MDRHETWGFSDLALRHRRKTQYFNDTAFHNHCKSCRFRELACVIPGRMRHSGNLVFTNLCDTQDCSDFAFRSISGVHTKRDALTTLHSASAGKHNTSEILHSWIRAKYDTLVALTSSTEPRDFTELKVDTHQEAQQFTILQWSHIWNSHKSSSAPFQIFLVCVPKVSPQCPPSPVHV